MGDNSRLAKNTIMLYIRMLAVTLISLYTSRIILQNLGVIDYGLYSVVGGIAVTFMFLNTAMNSSTPFGCTLHAVVITEPFKNVRLCLAICMYLLNI